MPRIAVLFAEKGGCYFGLPDVDPWDKDRDARLYLGPFPVVAHPPCERWGRFWHGSPLKPHQFKLGDDGACFAFALAAVRYYGGVLEHPVDSKAWDYFKLFKPNRFGGWNVPDLYGGRSCYVEQGNYGHIARKGTWLYAVRCNFPELRWGKGEQRLPRHAIERHGYKKARRSGMLSYCSRAERKATPIEFRDLLLSIAQTVKPEI